MSALPAAGLTPESLSLAKEIFAKETALEQQYGPAPRPARVLELQMQHKDGTSLWTEVKVSLLRNEAGTPAGILGVTRNISARKQAEAELKASEERFRNMADLLPGAVVETGPDLRVSYVNQHGLKLFGYSQADMKTGMHVLDCLHPEDRDKAAQRIASYFEDSSRPRTKQQPAVAVRCINHAYRDSTALAASGRLNSISSSMGSSL